MSEDSRQEEDSPASGSAKKPAPERVGDQTVALPSGSISAPSLVKEHAGLVVIRGQEIGREYRLRRRQSILGRGDEATLRIADDRVSRQHASVEAIWDKAKRLQRFYLADLGSTNKTYVNGDPITRVELKEGDKIRVGDTVLKFVVQD